MRQLLGFKETINGFWDKVDFSPTCWNWKGALNNGYGEFWKDGHHIKAHRFSYELMVSKIPDKLQIDHLCNNPSCVNPFHLQAVTARINNHRGASPASKNIRKTHCKRGHELKGDNLYERSNRRECYICKCLVSSEYRNNKN